ncbi:MAG: hypothetical protein ACF8XB_10070 [Planctomycetota bacterium JB042]
MLTMLLSLVAAPTFPPDDAPPHPVPPAIEAIRSAPCPEAWLRLDVLRGAAAEARPRDRTLVAAAGELGEVLGSSEDADRRTVAAVGLAVLGPWAEKQVDTLTAAIRRRPVDASNLAAALALASLGDAACDGVEQLLGLRKVEKMSWNGVKIDRYVLAESSEVDALLGALVAVELGEDARPLRKLLLRHVENLGDHASYLVHPHCIEALESTKTRSKAIAKRQAVEAETRRGGIVPPGKSGVRYVLKQIGFLEAHPERSLALPDETPNLDHHGSLGAAQLDLANHVVAEIRRIRAELLAGEIESLESWRERIDRITDTAFFLDWLDARS